jgi:hypothetical protein
MLQARPGRQSEVAGSSTACDGLPAGKKLDRLIWVASLRELTVSRRSDARAPRRHDVRSSGHLWQQAPCRRYAGAGSEPGRVTTASAQQQSTALLQASGGCPRPPSVSQKCCVACPLHLGATPRAGFQVASPSSWPLRNILSSKHRPACASRGRDPPHVVRHQNVLFVVLLPPLRVSLDCGSTRVWCREHHSRCRREGAAPLAKSKVSRQRVGAGRPTH